MSYLSAFYLTAESFRELVNIFDNTRILGGSGLTLNMVLHFSWKLRGRSEALCRTYSSIYVLTSYG